MTKLTDWISTGMSPASDGLRYGYDDGGRLTSIAGMMNPCSPTSLAFVAGSNPATGSYRYYTFDRLASTSEFRNDSKNAVASYEYGPHGTPYTGAGEDALHLYTDHMWEPLGGMYYAAFRTLASNLSRWLTPRSTRHDRRDESLSLRAG